VFDIKLSGTASRPSRASSLLEIASIVKSSHSTERITSQSTRSGGRHLVLTLVKKRSSDRLPLVEVSSDLIRWFSGPKHTEIVLDDATTLKVRDLTPHTPTAKRFIRVRWLGGN
jgi:hypothetical protein